MRLSKVILLFNLLVFIPIGSMAQLKADFIANITSVCSGSTVIFTDKTTGISGASPTYSWNFGTGASPATATGIGPHTVTYTGSGSSTVRLIVTDGANSSTETKNNYITVNPLPVPTISGAATACLNVSGNIYTTQAGMSNYAWTVSAGGTITAGGGSANNTVTVTWTTTGPKTISVNYTNSNLCTAASPAVFNVIVNSLPVPTISGPATACVNIAGNVYTTQAGMSNYIWSVSSGGTITSGGGSGNSSVTVTWTTTGAKTVSVNYTNTDGCTATTPTIYNVTANPLPVPSLAGPATACLNSTNNVYSTDAGMSNYAWTVSAGGTITAGGGTSDNTVTITWTTTGAKTVRVNYTNGNGCIAASPTVYNITVNALPVVNAGTNVSIPNGTSTTLNATVTGTGPFTYSWTPASLLVNPLIEDPKTVNLTSTTIFTLTATSVTTTCSNSDFVTVTVTGAPLSAAPTATPSTVCAGASVQLDAGASGGSGVYTYSWTSVPAGFTSTLAKPIANPLVTTTYRVAVNDGFNTVNAQVTVTVNALPVATAANNGPVCSGTTLNLTGGPDGMIAYSWSGPNGYSSAVQSPKVSDNATVVMAGIYTLTVTNNFGCQNTATTNVVVNASPVATASNNSPVCAGLPLRLSGGPSLMSSYSWTGPNGFTSFQQSPTVSLSATPAMAGKYILTVTNSAGCRDTASTRVYVNAPPDATASNNGPVCSGKVLTLGGGPAGMTSYLWSGPLGFTSTLQNPVVSNSATTTMAGRYLLTITNNSGCQDTASTRVYVNATPVATAANNGPICAGSVLALTGGPAGMTTYAWTGPNSFTSNLMSPTVSPAATLAMSGIYTLTVTGIAGCQDTATTRANVYAVPLSNAGTGGIECDLNFVLNAVPSVGVGVWTVVTGPGTAVFLPNANTPNALVTVSAYGTYTFRWTETNGPCISTSVVTVNFYQMPVANAGPDASECDLDYTMNAVPSVGIGTWTMISGTGSVTFTPNANSPVAVVTLSEYGSKLFVWSEVNGTCISHDTVKVDFFLQPVANAGTGGNNCGNEFYLNAVPSIGIGTWTIDSGPGTATFAPNANTPTARITVSLFGTYILRWTEVNGTCQSSATISLNFIQQPRADAGNGGDECDLNFSLNAVPATGVGTWTKLTGSGNAVFTPNPNQYNAVVTVSVYGAYDFAWTVVNSQCSSSDIVRVTFHDPPAVNAGPDLLICNGRSVQLSATGTGSFQWSPPGSLSNPNIPNPVATPQATTLYTVTLTDQWQCKNTDQVNVEVRVQPVADAGPDQTLEYLFETNLAAAPLGANQTGEWTLLDGEGNIEDKNSPSSHVSELSVDKNSFIWTVANGICPASADTVEIKVNALKIPTLITPNNDGANDYFVLMGLETFGKTSITVFNRWGGRVYENEEYDNRWDGTDEKGNPLPEDTYFIVIKPENRNTIKGYVVIRR